MVKHIVMWNFKEEVAQEDKALLKERMAEHLVSLVGKVPGLIDAAFVKDPVSSSTHEMALVTTFDSVESLKGYKNHPEHVKVADTYVRPYTAHRACLDYDC